MASTGVDWRTGKILRDFDHVLQSIEVILATAIGSRVLREWFGFPGTRLLGNPLNVKTVVKFSQVVTMALTIRQINGLAAEPRFKIRKITPISVDRGGHYAFRIEGDYMPRGHLGDTTVESETSFTVDATGGKLIASAA